MIAGIGLWLQKAWSARLAIAIAIATVAVFAAFGVYVLLGNAYESRTLVAMALRSGVWITVAFLSYRAIVARTRRM